MLRENVPIISKVVEGLTEEQALKIELELFEVSELSNSGWIAYTYDNTKIYKNVKLIGKITTPKWRCRESVIRTKITKRTL